MTEWILLAVSLLLMVACGVFVAAEFAFVTVDRATVDRATQAGERGAAGVGRALSTLSTQLSGAQLGITLTNLAIGYLAEPAIATLLRPPLGTIGVLDQTAVTAIALTIALFGSTVITMLIGELIPKNLALALPMRVAVLTQLPMRAFTKAMGWPIRWLNGAANAILRFNRIEPQEELRSARSPNELRYLIRRSASEGALDRPTADLVDRSIAFGDRTAADVRVARVRVRFLQAGDSAADLIRATRDSGHSRFPVYGRDADDVLGLVHLRQALAIAPDRREQARLGELVTPVARVPDTIELDPLLAELRTAPYQFALVIDEYGGTDGIVTLEDLVEEIVGEIADEHDRLATSVRARGGSWTLSGLLRPDEVTERTGIVLPEHPDYETIAGLVLRRLGRIAAPGDAVRVRGERAQRSEEFVPEPVEVELRVEQVVRRRIDRLRLTVLDEATPGKGDRR
ncbi:hemolysin family protein [Microlunatus parietis]|uniref:CBS domain containing-hemolysin-like protein n=1 Tax=Microlunatus parietis TaxID=682979 RepID=A0A7Y9I509_9ACTN|nr:hemolysin family protein [Microlunatus parietis]NYE70302.1 CBS domain containing-hemolysin-like protein [Microlunatus parietis]